MRIIFSYQLGTRVNARAMSLPEMRYLERQTELMGTKLAAETKNPLGQLVNFLFNNKCTRTNFLKLINSLFNLQYLQKLKFIFLPLAIFRYIFYLHTAKSYLISSLIKF